MELILIIRANDKNLTDVERSEIIKRTLDIYPRKQRRKTKHSEIEPLVKVVLMFFMILITILLMQKAKKMIEITINRLNK